MNEPIKKWIEQNLIDESLSKWHRAKEFVSTPSNEERELWLGELTSEDALLNFRKCFTLASFNKLFIGLIVTKKDFQPKATITKSKYYFVFRDENCNCVITDLLDEGIIEADIFKSSDSILLSKIFSA